MSNLQLTLILKMTRQCFFMSHCFTALLGFCKQCFHLMWFGKTWSAFSVANTSCNVGGANVGCNCMPLHCNYPIKACFVVKSWIQVCHTVSPLSYKAFEKLLVGWPLPSLFPIPLPHPSHIPSIIPPPTRNGITNSPNSWCDVIKKQHISIIKILACFFPTVNSCLIYVYTREIRDGISQLQTTVCNCRKPKFCFRTIRIISETSYKKHKFVVKNLCFFASKSVGKWPFTTFTEPFFDLLK